MDFKCKICNKLYSSYQSLWNHNHKYHNTNTTQTTTNDFIMTSNNFQMTLNDCKLTSNDFHQNNQFTCEFCKKTFSRKNNLNYHIKNKCKLKDKVEEKNNEIKFELVEIKNKITKLENKKNNKITNNI